MNSYWIYLFFNAYISHSSLFWRPFTNIALKLLMSDVFVKGKLHKWAKLERKFPQRKEPMPSHQPNEHWCWTKQTVHKISNIAGGLLWPYFMFHAYFTSVLWTVNGVLQHQASVALPQTESQWIEGERMKREGKDWLYGEALMWKWLNDFYTQDFFFFSSLNGLLVNILRPWTSITWFQQSTKSISNMCDQLAGFPNL